MFVVRSNRTTTWGDRIVVRLGSIVRRARYRGIFLFALCFAFLSGTMEKTLRAQPASKRSPAKIRSVIGITAPFREVVLGALQRGRLAEIAVEEGRQVKKGEVVFALADGVQRSRMEMARAAAESKLEMALAKADWDRAGSNLDRLVKLYGDDSASSKELADARMSVKAARIQYERASFAQSQEIRVYEREKKILDQFRVHAPFDGYVVEHLKEVGEIIDQNEGVVRLVQLDPLLVSFGCPLRLASHVHVGDRFVVRPIDSQWKPRNGVVSVVRCMADGASQTFKVKLAVENADFSWMSGLKVSAEFSGDGQTGEVTPVASPLPKKHTVEPIFPKTRLSKP